MKMENAVLYHRLDAPDTDSTPTAEPAQDPAGDTPVAATCDPSTLSGAVSLLRGESGEAARSLRRVEASDVTPAYNSTLRKFDPAFVYPAYGPPERLIEIENRLFAASYKGITDLVTKWAFPLPAREVVRALARRGVHPNTVTGLSYVLAILVTVLFAQGWFATGLCLGWVMTFLDTVDGKLARCTLTSTKFGNIFDHGLDLIHPPFWWGAWASGLPGGIAEHEFAFWVVVGGYILGRVLEGVFELRFGIQPHVWRRFDAFFRLIIARRNPNLLVLTASVIAGHPVWGFIAVTVWTALGVVEIATRGVQAHLQARSGVDIHSWLDDVGPGVESSTRGTTSPS
jgi:phosphatidylglycerophosphate synthase